MSELNWKKKYAILLDEHQNQIDNSLNGIARKDAERIVKWVKRHIDGSVHRSVHKAATKWLKKYNPDGSADE